MNKNEYRTSILNQLNAQATISLVNQLAAALEENEALKNERSDNINAKADKQPIVP